MSVNIPQSALDHVMALVDRDVQTTLGRSHQKEIRRIAEGVRSSLEDDAGETLDLDTFFDRVVVEVQQYLRDNSIQDRWPLCPTHADHGLELIDDHWTCAQDDKVYGRLGGLKGTQQALQRPVAESVAPGDLEDAFRRFAADRGLHLEADPHSRVFSTMLDFYAEVRAEGCDPANDEDMLLLEWGSFDWGSGRAYEIDLFRQLVLPAGAKDYTLAELHVVYRFEEEGGLVRLPAGNDWWGSPAHVGEFEEALAVNPALNAAQEAQPISVEIYFEGPA